MGSTGRVAPWGGRREPLKLIIGKYEGTIYPEGRGYTGAIDIGTGVDCQRLKRKGRTKEIVKDKLKKAVAELEAGIETSAPTRLSRPSATGSPEGPRVCRPRRSTTTPAWPSPT
jgi:hypothetical protein